LRQSAISPIAEYSPHGYNLMGKHFMKTADTATNSTSTPSRRIEISQGLTLGRASLLMAAMVALSRLTGFGRIMLTSYLYGRNATTDAYNAAFNIPRYDLHPHRGWRTGDRIRAGLYRFLSRGEEDAARRTFRAMLTLLGAAFGLLTLVLFVLTFTPLGTRSGAVSGAPRTSRPVLLSAAHLLIGSSSLCLVGSSPER
jgi:hypothetical protein